MQNGKTLSARDVFGETLRRNRVAAGLTTDALAELLDASTATINAWELGRYSPRDHNLARIHDLFDSLEAQIISETPTKETPTSAVKRSDVEAALSLSQSIEELLVTASSFTEDDQLQQFLAMLLNKARNLNGRLISIKAGLRD